MKAVRNFGVFHSVAVSAFVSLALVLLFRPWIPKTWVPGVGIALFAISLMILLLQVSKRHADNLRIAEQKQLDRIAQPQNVFGATHHGVIFANEQGLAITYMPSFEIFLKWEEITGYALFQADIETYSKGFTDNWIKPPTLPGRAHTLLITSTRTDMPATPVEIPKADLEFWSDVIDAGKSDPAVLASYPKQPFGKRPFSEVVSIRAKLALVWIVIVALSLIWMLRPGSNGRFQPMLFFVNMQIILHTYEPLLYRMNRLDPSLLHTLLRARGQLPEPGTLAAITDNALWLCRRGQVLDCVPINQLESVSLEPSDKVGDNLTKLTFNLSSGEPKEATLKPEHAASIRAQLRDLLPDLKFV